jgi:predicted ArsR family transcriptional regulator
MSLQYLQLARLNATPLARHIDTPEPAKQAPKTEAEYAAAMLAEAKQIRARHAGMTERSTTGEVAEDEILAIIAAEPGIDIAELARMVGRSTSNIRTRMSSMENRRQVTVEKFKHPKSFRWTRRFYPVAHPKPSKNGRPAKPSPRRDAVIAFLKAHPGCTSAALAEHLGCSVRAAGAHISEVRKVAKVRMERQAGGQHLPARYWIEEGAV